MRIGTAAGVDLQSGVAQHPGGGVHPSHDLRIGAAAIHGVIVAAACRGRESPPRQLLGINLRRDAGSPRAPSRPRTALPPPPTTLAG
jgi:hypothetical protein